MNTIGSVDRVLEQLQSAAARNSVTKNAAASPSNTPNDFSQAIQQALQNVSGAQSRASELQQRFQMEDPNVSLEQTMVAMQKGQIGFQAALQVRNRLVQSYTDIMNMQV